MSNRIFFFYFRINLYIFYYCHSVLYDPAQGLQRLGDALPADSSGKLPQGRCRVGSEMLFAKGQRGFADRRGMVRLREVCCK